MLKGRCPGYEVPQQDLACCPPALLLFIPAQSLMVTSYIPLLLYVWRRHLFLKSTAAYLCILSFDALPLWHSAIFLTPYPPSEFWVPCPPLVPLWAIVSNLRGTFIIMSTVQLDTLLVPIIMVRASSGQHMVWCPYIYRVNYRQRPTAFFVILVLGRGPWSLGKVLDHFLLGKWSWNLLDTCVGQGTASLWELVTLTCTI